MEPKTFTLYATLTDRGQAVGFYEDGRARIVLETDIRQFAGVAKLIAYGRQTPLKITIHIENPSGTI